MKRKVQLMIVAILLLQIVLPMVSIIFESGLTLISNAQDNTEYYINTAQDLWDFAAEVNNGNTFEGVTVYLMANIDLECDENNQWIPIGNCSVDAGNQADTTSDKNPFSGIFEGNNHTISRIYIDKEQNYMGLFGYNQGTIKNVILKDSYIKSTKSYIAGITAYNKRNSR